MNRRNGRFEFAIQQDDGTYSIEISKEGFITKRLKIKSSDFKFKYEYEFQEIEVEMILGTDELEKITVSKELVKKSDGQMNMQKVAKPILVKVDNSKVDSTLKVIDEAYQKAIVYGDNLVALEEYEYAKGYYEIARDLNPNKQYAQDQLNKMDKLILLQKQRDHEKHDTQFNSAQEGKEINHENSPTGIYFSVQLGAFLKKHDQNAFNMIESPIVVSGQDRFKRVLSGNFVSRSEAQMHLEEAIALGFDDAFLVKMQKNIRIGM